MASSAAAVQTIIDNIDTAIANILSGAASAVSEFTIGNTRIKRDASSLATLQGLRKMYQEELANFASEDMSGIDLEFGAFGGSSSTEWGEG